MRAWPVTLLLAACGDNIPGTNGPALVPADHLFIGAHLDDDTIFMQPEVVDAARDGSLTTVFVASGSGGQATFEYAMRAYAAVAGSSLWDCGYIDVEGAPVHHCRLRDRPVSLVGLDLPDGGIEGAKPESLLHLVQGDIDALPILGPIGGRATGATIIRELAAIIAATEPAEIHTLDAGATHGRDHSSHMLAASFAVWAMARVGFAGPVRWHRGYSVADQPLSFDGAPYDASKWMVGFFDACYFGCAPCGTSCETLDPSHQWWLHRQYSSARQLEATGDLDDGTQTIGHYTLGRDGHLATAGGCLGSTIGGGIELAACAPVPEQYWLYDDEGALWNGRPPEPSADMAYDHVRCLVADGAPICGSRLIAHWRFSE